VENGGKDSIWPNRWVHHRIALLVLDGCETAAPSPNQQFFRPDSYPSWREGTINDFEVNVSENGTFIGWDRAFNIVDLVIGGREPIIVDGGVRLSTE
jgi:hypothetical protein